MNVGDLIAPTSDLSAWDMNPVRKKHKPQELPLDLLLTEASDYRDYMVCLDTLAQDKIFHQYGV